MKSSRELIKVIIVKNVMVVHKKGYLNKINSNRNKRYIRSRFKLNSIFVIPYDDRIYFGKFLVQLISNEAFSFQNER